MLGTSLRWRSTVAVTSLKVRSAKCLCLLRWSWSCYFGVGLVSSGLGLGLKNLVLFTSLLITPFITGTQTKLMLVAKACSFYSLSIHIILGQHLWTGIYIIEEYINITSSLDNSWVTGIIWLMRDMATLSQGNQELLLVREKVERPQVSLR